MTGKLIEESTKRLTEKGVNFIKIDDFTPWKEAVKPVIDKYTKEYGIEKEYEELQNLQN